MKGVLKGTPTGCYDCHWIRKPDDRFYVMACEALGITPSQAVFLDDLGVNLRPARALGMITIKVTEVLLPDSLKDTNPFSIPRLVDGISK